MKIPRLLLVPLLVWLGTAPTAGARWTLSTDDTCIELAVSDDTIRVETFKNQAQGWNWTPAPSEVPLPGKSSVRAGSHGLYSPLEISRGHRRSFRRLHVDAAVHQCKARSRIEVDMAGTRRTGPSGELDHDRKPVGCPVTFHASIAAGRMRVRVDRAASLLRIEKTAVGKGRAESRRDWTQRHVSHRQRQHSARDARRRHHARSLLGIRMGTRRLQRGRRPRSARSFRLGAALDR